MISWLSDPIFRGPVLGSLLMSLSTSLVGAMTVLRRQSLIGEALSHATFPGVILGMLLANLWFPGVEQLGFLGVLIGALIAAAVGQTVIEVLLRRKEKSDGVLCYVLASFLGLGVLFASLLQEFYPVGYHKIRVFFYGQAATMEDMHIYLYGALAMIVGGSMALLHRPVQVSCFDPVFSQSLGIEPKWMGRFFSALLSLAIVIGIKTVGVVLMTGMLIAPAVIARCFAKKFSHFLMFSASAGILSSLLGSLLAGIPIKGEAVHYIPIGPATVIIASTLALIALMLSPKRGFLPKIIRRYNFRKNCLFENLLKALWRYQEMGVSWKEIRSWHIAHPMFVRYALSKLCRQGWLKEEAGSYQLTEDGKRKASYIVRLHRLWELYLAQHLGNSLDALHHSAEHMEHLITPDMEMKLTHVLLNPTKDPHKQPIPAKELL